MSQLSIASLFAFRREVVQKTEIAGDDRLRVVVQPDRPYLIGISASSRNLSFSVTLSFVTLKSSTSSAISAFLSSRVPSFHSSPKPDSAACSSCRLTSARSYLLKPSSVCLL